MTQHSSKSCYEKTVKCLQLSPDILRWTYIKIQLLSNLLFQQYPMPCLLYTLVMLEQVWMPYPGSDQGEENISRKDGASLSQTGHFQVFSFLPKEPQARQSSTRHSVIKSTWCGMILENHLWKKTKKQTTFSATNSIFFRHIAFNEATFCRHHHLAHANNRHNIWRRIQLQTCTLLLTS